MDNIITPTPKVTTGPLPASQKIYVTPDAAPDLSVPLREIDAQLARRAAGARLRHDRPLHRFHASRSTSQGPGAHAPRLGARSAAASRNMTAGRSSRSTTAT